MAVSALTLLVLALASYRITRLVVEDVIAEPPRMWAIRVLLRRPGQVRQSLVTLITCTFCAGWWVSGLVLVVYSAASAEWADNIAVYGITWFAVAGGAALLNAADTALTGGDES